MPAPGYTQLPVAPYAHAQPMMPGPAHPHPSLDGTAPPSTMQPTERPRRSGVIWLGVLLALFGLGALVVAFVVPQLTAGRSSASDAGERDEASQDDDRDRDDAEDEKRAAKSKDRDRDDPDPESPTSDKPRPGQPRVVPKTAKTTSKPEPTKGEDEGDDKPAEDKPAEDKPVADKPPPEEPPCNCPDWRPAGITCPPSKTLKACTPVGNPNACCNAAMGHTIGPYPACGCMFDACKLPGNRCNK